MQFELLLLLQPLIVQVLVYLLVDLRGGDGADGGGRVGGRQGLGGVLVTTLVVSGLVSAANRLIGEVVQSRRRPLLGPSPG